MGKKVNEQRKQIHCYIMNAVGLWGAIPCFFFKTSGSGTINLYKQTQTPKLMTCKLMRAVLLVLH